MAAPAPEAGAKRSSSNSKFAVLLLEVAISAAGYYTLYCIAKTLINTYDPMSKHKASIAKVGRRSGLVAPRESRRSHPQRLVCPTVMSRGRPSRHWRRS